MPSVLPQQPENNLANFFRDDGVAGIVTMATSDKQVTAMQSSLSVRSQSGIPMENSLTVNGRADPLGKQPVTQLKKKGRCGSKVSR